MMRADFSYTISDGTVYIIDEDKGNKSVTNDMENVLSDIESIEGSLQNYKIVYRDSQGIWERVIGWLGDITIVPNCVSDIKPNFFYIGLELLGIDRWKYPRIDYATLDIIEPEGCVIDIHSRHNYGFRTWAGYIRDENHHYYFKVPSEHEGVIEQYLHILRG